MEYPKIAKMLSEEQHGLLNKLIKKANTLKNRLDEVETDIQAEEAKFPIRCYGCKGTSLIKDIVYIQTHWYVEPYSCSGGDYWREGEGNFVCPLCNKRNRFHEASEEYEKLKYRFKAIEKVYER